MSQASQTDRNAGKQELLDPQFVRQLDRLDVLSRKILTGKLQGERRSKRKGQSVEFADYRNYVAGDDLRFIDWNLYARLDKLFLRLFMEEQDLSVAVAVDVSKSMDWGDPNKLDYARRVAAALGYIGLTHYNRVSIFSFADTIVDQMINMRGRRPIPQMLDFLSGQVGQGGGDLSAVCRRLALTLRGKGVVIILSDFLDKSDVNAALRYLAGDLHDVYLLQLLAPQEMDPSKGGIVGDLRLQDIEDHSFAEVSVSRALINRYKENLHNHCDELRRICLKRNMIYMQAETSVPFDTLVLQYLRQRGLVG